MGRKTDGNQNLKSDKSPNSIRDLSNGTSNKYSAATEKPADGINKAKALFPCVIKTGFKFSNQIISGTVFKKHSRYFLALDDKHTLDCRRPKADSRAVWIQYVHKYNPIYSANDF